MSIDVIGDFLTVIRNGLAVGKKFVAVPHSSMKSNIAKVLKEEGFIKDFKQEDVDGKASLIVYLKYVKGEPVIHEIKRISKPSNRYFERSNKLTSVIGGLGVSIISTSSGIVTDRYARANALGGEVICHVW
ncbi:MAG: 30S ribosomal protein S8 [Candidatus Babeliales bacterium]|jgi:small subunit ribosomal protein S8